jgi:hypothetical protein
MPEQKVTLIRSRLKAPRAGAIAGIVFSILLIISLVLIRISIPANPREAGTLLSGDLRNISIALNLLPFTGIAFLWFMGVLRDRIGEFEDRFFATVFLGSGLMFLAMLFVSSAVAGGLIMAHDITTGKMMESGIYTFGRTLAYQVINIYGVRMQGVFMITTSTLVIRLAILPRWMAYLGYGLALFLLVSITHFAWAPLVFPLWVLLISTYILLANLKTNPVPKRSVIM